MTHLNIEWNYHQAGNRSGAPILFLHGFMGHGRVWLPTMNQLPDNMNAIALDLPWHGSVADNPEIVDFDTLASAIVEFIDDNFDKPPVLVGYSMGGRIALYTALHFPEKVTALVMESSTAGIEDEEEKERRRVQDNVRAESLRHNGIRAYLADWYEQPLFASLKRQPGLIQNIIQKKLDNDPECLAEAMLSLSPGRQPSLWDRLGEWEKDTLIIAGDLDQKYCDLGRKMTSVMKNADLKIVPDAGHIVHLENNKDFVSALNFFLSSRIL